MCVCSKCQYIYKYKYTYDRKCVTISVCKIFMANRQKVLLVFFLRKKGEDEIYVHELSITNSKILRLTSALYCFQRVKVNFFMNLRMEII